MQPGLSKYTISFGIGVAIASVMNALLVVAKEKSVAFLSALQRMSGHHWTSHSIIVLGLFGISGLVFAQLNSGKGVQLAANALIRLVATAVLGSSLFIVAFYLING